MLEYVPSLILSTPTKPATTSLSLDEIEDIVLDMEDTMIAHNGVGIAANQCGYPYSIFIAVMDGVTRVFVDPVYKFRGGGIHEQTEGCLSIPNKQFVVERWGEVEIEYSSIYVEPWTRVTRNFTGFKAQVIQHEINHLRGLTIDKVGREATFGGIL